MRLKEELIRSYDVLKGQGLDARRLSLAMRFAYDN